MREILFRGKRSDNGEWIYGDLRQYVKNQNGYDFYQIDTMSTSDNDFGSGHTVVSETIGQFTVLFDKNGNKIFEGDILKCHYETYTKRWDECFEVIYFNGAFGLKTFDDKHFVPFSRSTHRYCEILGNIHDNPELLKAENNNE